MVCIVAYSGVRYIEQGARIPGVPPELWNTLPDRSYMLYKIRTILPTVTTPIITRRVLLPSQIKEAGFLCSAFASPAITNHKFALYMKSETI